MEKLVPPQSTHDHIDSEKSTQLRAKTNTIKWAFQFRKEPSNGTSKHHYPSTFAALPSEFKRALLLRAKSPAPIIVGRRVNMTGEAFLRVYRSIFTGSEPWPFSVTPWINYWQPKSRRVGVNNSRVPCRVAVMMNVGANFSLFFFLFFPGLWKVMRFIIWREDDFLLCEFSKKEIRSNILWK